MEKTDIKKARYYTESELGQCCWKNKYFGDLLLSPYWKICLSGVSECGLFSFFLQAENLLNVFDLVVGSGGGW